MVSKFRPSTRSTRREVGRRRGRRAQVGRTDLWQERERGALLLLKRSGLSKGVGDYSRSVMQKTQVCNSSLHDLLLFADGKLLRNDNLMRVSRCD